jgi:hypothetical protein
MKLQSKFRKAAFGTEPDGAFEQMRRHFAAFYRRSTQLVVTFDHMRSRDMPGPRYPWCYDKLVKRGISHLGIMMGRRNDWFRHADLFDYFDGLKAQGFFDQFDDVLFYGSSMGGFGACAFAAAAPGARILALMPQSTLAPDLVPSEQRYRRAYARGDWDDPRYRDGAQGIAASAQAQIVYDPYFAQDRLHAMRLDGPRVTHLKAFFAGHNVTRALHFNGLLKHTLNRALERDPVTQQEFNTMYRTLRHAAPSHMRKLALRAVERGSVPRLDAILKMAEARTDKRYLAIRRMRDQLLA